MLVNQMTGARVEKPDMAYISACAFVVPGRWSWPRAGLRTSSKARPVRWLAARNCRRWRLSFKRRRLLGLVQLRRLISPFFIQKSVFVTSPGISRVDSDIYRAADNCLNYWMNSIKDWKPPGQLRLKLIQHLLIVPCTLLKPVTYMYEIFCTWLAVS